MEFTDASVDALHVARVTQVCEYFARRANRSGEGFGKFNAETGTVELSTPVPDAAAPWPAERKARFAFKADYPRDSRNMGPDEAAGEDSIRVGPHFVKLIPPSLFAFRLSIPNLLINELRMANCFCSFSRPFALLCGIFGDYPNKSSYPG